MHFNPLLYEKVCKEVLLSSKWQPLQHSHTKQGLIEKACALSNS